MLLQKCPKLVPFHSGTFGDKEYQGRKEINVALHTLNQRSRDNPKVNGHEMYNYNGRKIVFVDYIACILLGRHLSLSSPGECSCLEGCCKCCAGPAGVPC